jgi:nicotinamide-nucleotide amidase
MVLDTSAEEGEQNLRKVLAQVSGSSLVLTEDYLQDLRNYYRDRGVALPKDIDRRALIPKDARWIPPQTGVRPGIWIEVKGKHLVVLPGDAREVEQMWDRTLRGWIGNLRGLAAHSRFLTVRFLGRSTSRIESTLRQSLSGAPMSFHVDGCLCQASFHLEGPDPQRLDRELERYRARIVGDLKQDFLGEGEEPLQALVGRLLMEKSNSIAIAESCTGGLITAWLVEVPGISSVLDRGVVTYSNRAKTDLLAVPEEVFQAHGAVSRVAARTMATGIRSRAGTDLGLSVTGIAGPSGGTPDKPVGTVFIGLATPEGNEVTEYHFKGDRKKIRFQSAQMALDRVRRYLLGF